jgi:phosphoribosylanthranilate isomerase
MKVKICGLTTLEDAQVAAESGADFLGFIFYAPSPRYVNEVTAGAIMQALRAEFGPTCPKGVGVFVNTEPGALKKIMQVAHLDFVQLSGDESPGYLAALDIPAYKAIQPQNLEQAQESLRLYTPHGAASPDSPNILVDAYHPHLRGGTGDLADTALVAQIVAQAPRMMLAGGLTPENVAGQIRALRPFGVDVASGVEASKGRKDHDKVRAFIQQAHIAAKEITTP